MVPPDTEVCGRGGEEMFDMSFDTITDLTDKRNVKLYLVSEKHFIQGHVGND